MAANQQEAGNIGRKPEVVNATSMAAVCQARSL